jgi:flagellin-like protein
MGPDLPPTAGRRVRGQSGIGTLIILIAMILVATIAAGVFFETIGSLQADAGQTSEESASQVTTRLAVVNVVGTDISDNAVGTVEVTVRSASRSGSIDLGETVAQWLGPDGAADLTLSGTADGDHFSVVAARDADGSITGDAVLNDPADRATLRFDATAIAGSGLRSGETVTLQFDTQTGGRTDVHIVVPEQVPDGSTVSL